MIHGDLKNGGVNRIKYECFAREGAKIRSFLERRQPEIEAMKTQRSLF